jgi:hypothetical protein
MGTTRRYPIRRAVLGVALTMVFLATAHAADHAADHHHDHMGHAAAGGAPPGKMHQAHVVANHGLIMALQGANLAMLGQLKTAPGVDETMVTHGREMIRKGAAAIREVEQGPDMTALRAAGSGDDSLMKHTHGLLDVTEDVLKKLDKAETSVPAGDVMSLRHMQIALVHALITGVDGANLVMLGRMKRSEGTDESSIRHGQAMMADARALWKEIVEGKAMKEIHARGMSPKIVPMMGATHRLAEAGGKVLDTLEKMSGNSTGIR